MKRTALLLFLIFIMAFTPVFADTETAEDTENYFDSLQKASDYITDQIGSGNREFEFYYTGIEDGDAISLMRMSAGLMGVYGGEGALSFYSKATNVDGTDYYRYTVKTTYLTKKRLNSAITIAEKVAKNAKKKSTKQKKYLYINNWMKKNIKFTTKQGIYDTIYGALVKGKADANAYAATFALICKKAGLECEYVSGNRTGNGPNGLHCWNIIKIGKKWYSVDVSMNDYYSNNKYFKCTKSNKTFWKGRTLLDEYTTKAYKKDHPMAS